MSDKFNVPDQQYVVYADKIAFESAMRAGKGCDVWPKLGSTQLLGREFIALSTAPIDMVLHCPACGLQHIDAPELDHLLFDDKDHDRPDVICDSNGQVVLGLCKRCNKAEVQLEESCWTNPPHRSHLCHGCGHIWRPADVPTNGVAATKTKGKNDSQIVTRARIQK